MREVLLGVDPPVNLTRRARRPPPRSDLDGADALLREAVRFMHMQQPP